MLHVRGHWSPCVMGLIQEIRANAHETRDSTSLISYAVCLGLLSLANFSINSLSVRCSLEKRKIHLTVKTHILGVQGRSRSSMLVPPESSSEYLLW